MALSIAQLSQGYNPIVEIDVPMLRDSPNGSIIKCKLLSRQERRRIYPDDIEDLADPNSLSARLREEQEAVQRLNIQQSRISNRLQEMAAMVDQAEMLSGEADGTDATLALPDPEERKTLLEEQSTLAEQAMEIAPRVQKLNEEATAKKLEDQIQLMLATVTDDAGDYFSEEQVRVLILDIWNEKVREEFIGLLLNAHGIGGDVLGE